MSLISDGINGLLAVTQAAPALHGVQIVDGLSIEYVGGSCLVIGLDAEDEYPVDGTSAIAGLAGARRMDIASIACLAWSASGNVEMAPRRAEADAWFDAVRALLAADNTLGGAVKRAQIVSYDYKPVRSDKGAGAAIEFRVQVVSI